LHRTYPSPFRRCDALVEQDSLQYTLGNILCHRAYNPISCTVPAHTRSVPGMHTSIGFLLFLPTLFRKLLLVPLLTPLPPHERNPERSWLPAFPLQASRQSPGLRVMESDRIYNQYLNSCRYHRRNPAYQLVLRIPRYRYGLDPPWQSL